MQPYRGISKDILKIDPVLETERIVAAIREIVLNQLKRKGAVIGVSGGIDSSVVAFLCARALGKDRVLVLFTPETDSSSDSLRLGRMVAECLDVRHVTEDITPILRASGCYARRDDAVRRVIPEYRESYRCKIILPNPLQSNLYAIFSLVVPSPLPDVNKVQ